MNSATPHVQRRARLIAILSVLLGFACFTAAASPFIISIANLQITKITIEEALDQIETNFAESSELSDREKNDLAFLARSIRAMHRNDQRQARQQAMVCMIGFSICGIGFIATGGVIDSLARLTSVPKDT